MLEYLHARGLHDDVLHANRVGADPGPRHLARARGLPARGPAVIFPVLDAHGPIYLQARYLNPDQAGGRKYDNPATWVATNPRYAHVVITRSASRSAHLFICEGLPDALTVAQVGSPTIAVLGVGLAHQGLAEYIQARHSTGSIVIAFDADPRGAASTRTLARELRRIGQREVHQLNLPAGVKDLNQWAVLSSPNFEELVEPRIQRLPNNRGTLAVVRGAISH